MEVVDKAAGDAAECKTDEVKSNGESEKEKQNENEEKSSDLENKIIRQIEVSMIFYLTKWRQLIVVSIYLLPV